MAALVFSSNTFFVQFETDLRESVYETASKFSRTTSDPQELVALTGD